MGLLRWILVFSALWAASCSPQKERVADSDPLEASYRKIDRGDYTEAIEDLKELMSRDSRPRVREALASAYAARAGLMIDSYWGFMVGFNAPQLSGRAAESSGPYTRARKILANFDEETQAAEGSGLARLARLMGTLQMWVDRLDTLPTVHGQARRDVDAALKVLDKHEGRGARLYRALLGLVTFKTDITDGFEGWARVEQHLRKLDFARPNSAANKAILCQIDVKAFAAWSGGVLSRLNSTAEDVLTAFPSKRDGVKNALEQSWTVSKGLQLVGLVCL